MKDPAPQRRDASERAARFALRSLSLLSAGFLGWVLLLHESVVAPAVLDRWSWRFLGFVVATVAVYLGGLWTLAGARWMRGWPRNVMLAVVTTASIALASELLFRAAGGFGLNRASELRAYRASAGTPEAEFVFVGELSKKNEFRVRHRLNSIGFNDLDYTPEKPRGVYRVLILGDSFVEGLQVDRTSTFHARVEDSLRQEGHDVEMIAIARSGWGTVDAREALRAHGLGFHPDLVVLAFFGTNDVGDNLPLLRERYAAPSWVVPRCLKRRVGAWSDLGYLMLDMVDHLARELDGSPSPLYDVFDPAVAERDVLWARAWDETFDALTTIQAEVRDAGAEFLIAYIPAHPETAARGRSPYVQQAVVDMGWDRASITGLDFTLPERKIREFSERQGIALLPLTDFLGGVYGDVRDPPRLYFPFDGHWTELGHRVAAEVFHVVLRERYLPRSAHLVDRTEGEGTPPENLTPIHAGEDPG